jgi:hypothetical protein
VVEVGEIVVVVRVEVVDDEEVTLVSLYAWRRLLPPHVCVLSPLHANEQSVMVLVVCSDMPTTFNIPESGAA